MIFDLVRAKALSRGTPIDETPEFLGWVERWITGDYEISELRSRYNDLAARRAQQSGPCEGREQNNTLGREEDRSLDTEADPFQNPARDTD